MQKLFPVFTTSWGALVSFAGVASTSDGFDTSEWLATALAAIPMDADFATLEHALLRAEGGIASVTGERRLTFSVVAFVGQVTMQMLVSNFQRFEAEDLAEPGRFMSSRREIRGPRVFVGGDRSKVTRRDEAQLLRKVRDYRREPLKVQDAIAAFNADVSQRSSSVSAASFTGHILPSGRAELKPHGIDPTREFLPNFALKLIDSAQIDLAPQLDENGTALPRSLVGLTATFEPAIGAMGILAVFRNVQDPVSTRQRV